MLNTYEQANWASIPNTGVNMAKRARKTKKQQHYQQHYENNNVIHVQDAFRKRKRHVTIIPRNIAQEDYVTMLDDRKKNIVFSMGPAGTGKTLLGVLSAIDAYNNGACEKIVVTRPAVSLDEQHGFLPGTLVEKMATWTRPIFDVMEEYWSPKTIESMIEDNVIEIAPLAYMRGRTLNNACIILDEAQNATVSQIKMFLTRLGEDSKMIITGDETQIDLHNRDYSGLKKTRKSLSNIEEISVVEFKNSDIVRNKIVSKILEVFPDK